MKQKKMSGSIFALAILGILLLFTACTQVPVNTTNTTPAKGRVVMTVTDALVNVGTINSLKMTIDSVAFHSDANGWVTMATPHLTYDLIALKASGNNALLADLTLLPARYDQMRFEVSNVRVTKGNVTYDVKMPSSTLRLNGEIVVLADKTATVSIDFIADQSLHMTRDGKYVFAPVIQLESKTDANADTSVSDNVRLYGGTIQTSSRVGMDVLGNLVIGGTLPPIIQINDDGTISGTEDALNKNQTN